MHSRLWLLLIPVLVAPDLVGAQAAPPSSGTGVRIDLRFIEAMSDRVEDLHVEDATDADIRDGRWSLAVGRFQPFANLRLALDEAPDGFRSLSAPRVVTRTGRSVVIHQRSRLRVRAVGAQGMEERRVSCDLEARITPRVREDGSVRLDMDLTREEPEAGTSNLVAHRAQIQIVVADGEAAYVRGMAAAGDFAPRGIPILGRLFRGSRAETERAELLMFVAPQIVR